MDAGGNMTYICDKAMAKTKPVPDACCSMDVDGAEQDRIITGTIEGTAVNYRLNEEAARWFRSVISRCF